MRRTLLALASTSLLLAACGDDDSEPAATEARESDGTEVSDTEVSDTQPAEPAPDDEGGADPGPPPTSPDKPAVEIPAELPTALETTVLIEGDGPPAEDGDTVIVDYIGVRSSDGVEFDNSYDRFEPFPVTLGTGSVIVGWEQGLLGSRTGERVQLDIPSDLAYGDQARGDVIGANEALTFVIDVRSVIKQPDPTDEPVEAGVPTSEGATELTTVDLIEGEGAELEMGQTAVMHLVLFRADELTRLDSTWIGEPIQIPMAEGQFPGLVQGMPGMNVGGRRAITMPPELAFGPEGNPQLGLPAATDVIIVVDLLGAY